MFKKTNKCSLSRKLLREIDGYISENYLPAPEAEVYCSAVGRAELTPGSCEPTAECPMTPPTASMQMRKEKRPHKKSVGLAKEATFAAPPGRKMKSLDEALSGLDESFSDALLRMIDERGMTDAECYKKAFVDRKLFSKIRGDRIYRPSKPTTIAFAVALELTLDQTNDLLRKAGYALSHSSKADVIVEYFIVNGKYSILDINEALYAYDQPLLGA